jgi:hypothetical protein
MNKLIKISILLFTVSLLSCEKEDHNVSKIRFEVIDDFIISSIQEGPEDQVICIGLINGTDSTVVLRYDKDLNLIETVYAAEIDEFDGNVKIVCLKEKGWLISGVKESGVPQIITIRADINFNVLKKETIKYPVGTTLLRIIELKSSIEGGVLMSISFQDDGPFSSVQGSIIRLDQNLKENFRFHRNGSELYRIIELPDESIFYVAMVQGGSWVEIRPGVFSIENSKLHVGQLTKNGSMKFIKSNTLDVTHLEAIGLSSIGDKMVYNFIVNDEHIQNYISINPNDGDIIKEATLGYNYINNQTVTSYYNGHFPLGQANALPEELREAQGHVLYSEIDKKVKMLTVDGDVNLQFTFTVPLPEFSEVYSYRQLYTKDGTVLVGCSYNYNNKHYFNLMELETTGRLVK